MKSIGFKNFRKFVEFPEMRFNDITLMVGANNSGKSTLVKAVLLVMDYLKNQQNQSFSFTTENVKDVNIISFDRARCKLQSDDFIYFKCQIASHYEVEIKISGDENSINANVEEVTIADTKRGLVFVLSHTTNSVKISKKNTVIDKLLSITKNIEDDIKRIDSKIKELSEQGIEGIDILREIDNLNKDRKNITERQKVLGTVDSNDSFNFSYEFSMDRTRSSLNFQDYIDEFLDQNENEKRRLINLREKGEFTEDLNEKLEEINLVFASSSELKDSIAEFISAINSHYYYYWSAETQKQSALFSIRDDNNSLAKAIHDFCKLRIQRGDDEWLFVENQMRGFEIGERLEIISHVGEAYECNIFETGSSKSISLADKGMGSIQLMTLFFRLVTTQVVYSSLFLNSCHLIIAR